MVVMLKVNDHVSDIYLDRRSFELYVVEGL